MDELFKKGAYVFSAVMGGLVTGYIITRAYQKKKEEAMGGKLMRVNYRFTKDFDD